MFCALLQHWNHCKGQNKIFSCKSTSWGQIVHWNDWPQFFKIEYRKGSNAMSGTFGMKWPYSEVQCNKKKASQNHRLCCVPTYPTPPMPHINATVLTNHCFQQVSSAPTSHCRQKNADTKRSTVLSALPLHSVALMQTGVIKIGFVAIL